MLDLKKTFAKKLDLKLVARVSHLTAPLDERGETLDGSGHVFPRDPGNEAD